MNIFLLEIVVLFLLASFVHKYSYSKYFFYMYLSNKILINYL